MGGGFVFSHLTAGGLFEAAVVAQLLIDYGIDYTQPCTVQTCNLILCYCESIFEHFNCVQHKQRMFQLFTNTNNGLRRHN